MCFIRRIKEKRARKHQEKLFSIMYSSVEEMLGVELEPELLKENIHCLSQEEIENLIERIKAGTNERQIKYLVHSIRKHQDMVFSINCLSLVKAGKPFDGQPYNTWHKRMDAFSLKDQQVMLFYDDFGFDETHLAARGGYVIMDCQVNEILAYRWIMIS